MSNFNKLRSLVFIRFFAESLFFPFISLFLNQRGLSTHEIGIIIASIPIVSLIMAPIYSLICKNAKKAKMALTIMTFIEPVFVLVLIYSNTFILSLFSVILIAMFSSSQYGLLDSIMAISCKESNKSFSSIRVCGSIAYVLGVLVSGLFLKFTTYNVLYIIASILFVITGIIYLFIKVNNQTNDSSNKVSYKEIFKNKVFVMYMIFYILLIGIMQVGDDFFSLYLNSKGCPDYYYSYVMVGFILIEIITLFTYKYWYKLVGLNAYLIAISILVIRLFFQMLPFSNEYVLIVSQLLRGITWGIALAINSIYIVNIVGINGSTRAIVITQFGVSLFNAIFKFSGGYIIEAIGYSKFYMILFVLASITLIYYLFYKTISKRLLKEKTII